MRIDYSKPIDFDKIENLSIIDESKLDSRARIQYKKALKARSAAEVSVKKSNERAEAVQNQLNDNREKALIRDTVEPENKPVPETIVPESSTPETSAPETTAPVNNERTSRRSPEDFPRYVGRPFEELIKAVPVSEARILQMKVDEDFADELDDQARRRRKEYSMSYIMKVGLQIVLEMPDKEYADLKLRAQSEGKSVGTVVHEALSKHLYG